MYKIKDIIKSQDYSKVPSNFLFKYLFIPLAWPLTFILINLGVSPNQATYIRIIIHLGSFITGYILIYLAIIFDCVDGQIARTKNNATYFGKFLDGWIDCIFEVSFVIFIALTISQQEEGIINIALLASLMNALYWITLLRFSIIKENKKKYKFNKIAKQISELLDKKLLVYWFDIKYFIFPFFIIFNKEKEFIYLLLIANSIFFLVYSLQKMYIGYLVLNVHKISSTSK